MIESNLFFANLAAMLSNGNCGAVSDGDHTFAELYHHRAVLTAALCNAHPKMCWKSKQHHDGAMYPGYFIVGIDTPYGQATYHYPLTYWDMFNVDEFRRAPKWDRHTSAEAIERIAKTFCDFTDKLSDTRFRCTSSVTDMRALAERQVKGSEGEKFASLGGAMINGILSGLTGGGEGFPDMRNPEGPRGPKGKPGPNALNPYHDYDILTQDRTSIHLADVLRNDDSEWGFHHFYDRRGVCVLSLSNDYVYSIALVDEVTKQDTREETS